MKFDEYFELDFVLFEIVSNHVAPHHIASHRIESNHIASHHITSHRIDIASHDIAPHRIKSNRISSHRVASHHITSYHIASHASHGVKSHRIKSNRRLRGEVVFFKHKFCIKPYVPRETRRDPSNRRLNEHGIYIRHCQESNSQPVPSQAEADPTRLQWRKCFRFYPMINCS